MFDFFGYSAGPGINKGDSVPVFGSFDRDYRISQSRLNHDIHSVTRVQTT